MMELILDFLVSLIPDLLDDWIQSKLDKVRSKHLRRFLRVVTWLLCALLEIAIAVALLVGLWHLVVNLGHWFLDLMGIT